MESEPLVKFSHRSLSLLMVMAMGKQEPQNQNAYPGRRLARAREVVRSQVATTTSLVDELIAERREEARREQSEH